MTEATVLDIMSEAIWVMIITSGPLLLVSLAVGLLVSIFQTVTSIQEQTLTFIPKIISIFLGMIILGSYMLNNLVGIMETLWNFSDFM